MAEDPLRALRRAFTRLDGPKLHERLTALLALSAPGRLNAALHAVLAMHEPVPGDWGTSCSCWERGGSHPAYPCPEVTAILLELTELLEITETEEEGALAAPAGKAADGARPS